MIFGLIISGIIGGVIGGMGMGGGTLLIPLLTELFGINQRLAQGLNLVVFIPMSVVALTIHFKKRLVKTEGIILIVLFGLAFCVLGSFLANKIESDILKRGFGAFLIIISVFQFMRTVKN